MAFNYDDENARSVAEKLDLNSTSYGFSEGAKIMATDLLLGYKNIIDSQGNTKRMLRGLSFKLNYQGKIIPVRLNHCISRSYVYSVLAAFCVGEYFKLNMIDMIEAVKDSAIVPGRMSLINGIKNSLIIDDTYNSAPNSVRLALETMSNIKAKRKIIVLGDMLELGKEEESSHEDIIKRIFENNFSFLLVVGKRMRKAIKKINQKQEGEKIFFFDNPMDAGKFLQELMKPEDLILIKGSQGLRMEKVVEEVMAEPNLKEKLLVRQSENWQATPFEEV